MSKDQFCDKGAVEQDTPTQKGNENMAGQLGHRDQDPLIKSADTDFPEPGNNEEHTGEPREGATAPRPRQENPEHEGIDQDPGERQKRNQGDRKDDPLAA